MAKDATTEDTPKDPFRMVISDERVVNTYGCRVMTAGIDISQYERNNVMLYMHLRGEVIGKFINLRKEGPVLTGEPVFDEKDARGAKCKQQLEDGFLRACSPELEPTEWSDLPELLLAGQTFPTATKSKLYEISICDIPGNDGALLSLSLPGGSLRLSKDAAATAEIFKTHFPTLHIQNEPPQMKLLLSHLGLADNATETDAVTALNKLKNDGNSNTANAVLKLAKQAGVTLTPEKEASFLKLAKLDPEAALDMLDFSTAKPAPAAAPVATPPADNLRLAAVVDGVAKQLATQPAATDATDTLDRLLLARADWTARDWDKKDPTNWLKLKREKPSIHDQMTKAFYNIKG
jgi:hypothetical protein